LSDYRSDLPLLLVSKPSVSGVLFFFIVCTTQKWWLPRVDQSYVSIWRDAAGPLQRPLRALREIHRHKYAFVWSLGMLPDHEYRLIAEPNHSLSSGTGEELFEALLAWPSDDREINLVNLQHLHDSCEGIADHNVDVYAKLADLGQGTLPARHHRY